MKYVYPAIFHYAKDGISVSFLDLPGCLSCGDDEKEALYMAKDVLVGYLYFSEVDNDDIPKPSDPITIPLEQDEQIKIIEVDTDEVWKRKNKKRNQ